MYKLPEFFLTLKEVVDSFNLPKPLQVELFCECLKAYGYWYYYQSLPSNFEEDLKTLCKQAKSDLSGFDEVLNVFKTYCFL
jgi:hypothetical protein